MTKERGPLAVFEHIRNALPGGRGSAKEWLSCIWCFSLTEALAKAVEKDVEGTPARVFTAEHLAAIALETGRAKDKARVLQFIEADAIDLDRLQEILTRHGLAGVWEQFERQFLK